MFVIMFGQRLALDIEMWEHIELGKNVYQK